MEASNEARRWLSDDLANSPAEDAEFVKRFIERRRANMGRLFELSAFALTLAVAMLAIPGALPSGPQSGSGPVDALTGAFIGGAVLLVILVGTYIWGLVMDDRLDRVDNHLTGASAMANSGNVTVVVKVRKNGKWRVRSHCRITDEVLAGVGLPGAEG